MGATNRLKHNKRKNPGLVHELALRRFGETLISGDRQAAGQVARFIERSFDPSRPVSRELGLHDMVRQARGSSRHVCERVIAEVRARAASQDLQGLAADRDRLGRDFQRAIGRDFAERTRVSEYRAYATTQLFMDAVRSGDVVQAARLEEALLTWMASPQPLGRGHRPDVDNLVVAKAKQGLDRKYGAALSGGQRSFLEDYVKFAVSRDRGAFARAAGSARDRIARVFVAAGNDRDIRSDAGRKRRFLEAAGALASLDVEGEPERVTEEIMTFQRLADELSPGGEP